MNFLFSTIFFMGHEERALQDLFSLFVPGDVRKPSFQNKDVVRSHMHGLDKI
jgi:hypothetical protein